jgi:glycogen debranching enzyme
MVATAMTPALLLGITAAVSPLPPAVAAIAERPNLFRTRTYQRSRLPTFAETRWRLPEPVIADHPEWATLYWKAWESAFSHFKQPEPTSGFVSNFIDPAFNEKIYQWDTCFMVMFAHYASPDFEAIHSLDNFYAKQHDDGYICREIMRETGKDFIYGGIDDTINPPLFSWVEWQRYLLTGDKSRLTEVLAPLVKYYAWLRVNRRRENGAYWNTGLGSGEDDLMRADSAYSWVDMTSQQASNAYYLARMTELLGDKEAAQFFDGEYGALSEIVNSAMWDEKIGFYFDLKKDGSSTRIKTVVGFWPMLAHIATADQAAKLVRHLQDPKEFWRPNVVPALPADEPGYSPEGQYWNGAVWAPTNFMVVKGLEGYGYDDLALRVTARYLKNMSAVLTTTGNIWENYAPESATGLGVADLVGWSGDGPIALLIENVLGIHAQEVPRQVRWRPRLPGENGLCNLTVGSTHVTLIASPIQGARGSVPVRDLSMTTDEPITVIIDAGASPTTEFRLKRGTFHTTVPARSVIGEE